MTARALVFDLDDTLMDTHGQLVMEAHLQACAAMQRAGLDVSLEDLMATRRRLLQEQPREEVNALLAAQYNCQDAHIIQAGFDTFLNPHITELEAFPGVHDLLAELAQSYDLFLVTAGSPQAQQKKIEVLEIGDCFREIHYIAPQQPDGKYQALVDLQQAYGYAFADMIVIGDRIHNEIAAGNRLGCPTIWLRHGEFAHLEPEGPHEEPSLMAEVITQLPALLAQLDSRSQAAG